MALTDTARRINGNLKILVLGAGAIGTYIGGSLALAGHPVVFLERESKMDELRTRGLRLDLTLDKRRNTNDAYRLDSSSVVFAASLDEALRYGPFDLILFALKSYDTPAVLEQLKPYAEKLPPILCLSNGLANEPAIAQALGADKVIYGTVTTAVGKRAPGDIILERLRGVGIAKGHPLSEKINTAFNKAFLNAQLYESAAAMKWSKLLTNLLANPASAIFDLTAAQIFADSRLYKMEITMLRECLAVMNAQQIEVVDLPGAPVRALAFATKLPLWLSKPLVGRAAGAGRGNKMPSFHIDLHAGRAKSEVDYLHGEVVRAGKQFNVPTPVNSLLTETLLALVNKQLPLDEYAHKPEKLLAKLSA